MSNIQEVSLGFRTHRYRFFYMEKVAPDFVMEHLVRNAARRLKLKAPDWPGRRVCREVRQAIVGNRPNL